MESNKPFLSYSKVFFLLLFFAFGSSPSLLHNDANIHSNMHFFIHSWWEAASLCEAAEPEVRADGMQHLE